MLARCVNWCDLQNPHIPTYTYIDTYCEKTEEDLTLLILFTIDLLCCYDLLRGKICGFQKEIRSANTKNQSRPASDSLHFFHWQPCRVKKGIKQAILSFTLQPMIKNWFNKHNTKVLKPLSFRISQKKSYLVRLNKKKICR